MNNYPEYYYRLLGLFNIDLERINQYYQHFKVIESSDHTNNILLIIRDEFKQMPTVAEIRQIDRMLSRCGKKYSQDVDSGSQEAMDSIKQLISDNASLLGSCWHIGDGNGGWILQLIEDQVVKVDSP